ncbi:DUF6489 family protein [Plasticicumulans sp.]|uniref:DUF6489 family protein n=1 Tax=Plasticicumulans sp. TaxID=2307179 RepID=UPI00322097EC
MKLNVNVEATPQELREFLGLPNVQPLQQEMMEIIRENMLKGVQGFDPVSLMKPFMAGAMPVQSIESLQKVFWDTFNKASTGQPSRTGTTGGS